MLQGNRHYIGKDGEEVEGVEGRRGRNRISIDIILTYVIKKLYKYQFNLKKSFLPRK